MSDPLIDQLTALLEDKADDYTPEVHSVLDDVVHDAASSLASQANNDGISGQIAFLRAQGWDDNDITTAFKERI